MEEQSKAAGAGRAKLGPAAGAAAWRGSLEPNDAWIGVDPAKPARRRAERASTRVRRRSRGGALRFIAIALLTGSALAYFAPGSSEPAPDGAEPVLASVQKPEASAEDDKALADIEAKRAALLAEIKRLETQRSEEQGQISELATRRSSLNQELADLEGQRKEWVQQLSGQPGTPNAEAELGAPADARDAEIAAAPQPLPAERPASEAPVPSVPTVPSQPESSATAEQVAQAEAERREGAEQAAKVEEERLAKIEALAAVERKEAEAQNRIRELQERRAAAEKELAAKRRERAAQAELARAKQAEEARKAQETRRFAALPEGSGGGLLGGLFSRDPVAGFAREQRSSYLPVPASTRYPAPPAAPSRVYVHYSAFDPEGKAKASHVARRLMARGFQVAELRPVRTRVRSSTVRFFHEQDRAAAPALRGALAQSLAERGAQSGTRLQDLRSFERPPQEGTLEVWLAE